MGLGGSGRKTRRSLERRCQDRTTPRAAGKKAESGLGEGKMG